MATSSKDIEILWKRYSDEGVKRGISVTQFFESNGVPYRTFERWYKQRFQQPSVVDCVVDCAPEETTQEVSKSGQVLQKTDCMIPYVNIGLKNGIKIEHHKLSYPELLDFIPKIESLCVFGNIAG
jgi:hypothetical protein